MSKLTPGDGLLLRAFSDHPSPTVRLDYKAPPKKGQYHLCLWLGLWEDGAASVDERLNTMGWVYDPERARAAIAAAKGADR